MNFMIGKAYP